jgi:hypothetical protein
MSDDDLDAQVWELHCQGLPTRQIAGRLGVNKDKVHRIIKRLTEALATIETEPDTDDDDSDDPCSSAAYRPEPADDDDYDMMRDTAPRPWVYVGDELTELPQGRGEESKWAMTERWLDGTGAVLNYELERYRVVRYLNARGDREAAKRFEADCERWREEYEQRERIVRRSAADRPQQY